MNIYISLIITMVFSAFFSGMEIAFVSVDKLRFEMERKGGITSRILSGSIWLIVFRMTTAEVPAQANSSVSLMMY